MVDGDEVLTVRVNVLPSVLHSKPGGGVIRMSAYRSVPETVSVLAGDAVPYVVVIGDRAELTSMTGVTGASGSTLREKIVGSPGQAPVAVTERPAVTGALPVLTAVNEGILPFPLAASPIDGL